MEFDHLLIGIKPVLHLMALFIIHHLADSFGQYPAELVILIRRDVQNLSSQLTQRILLSIQIQGFLANIECDGLKHPDHLFFVSKRFLFVCTHAFDKNKQAASKVLQEGLEI
ncbi:hypothetical protein [uncultured Subdoligranulum sp.]|uniref:hypothetical protein n=1 Tax=uncultured Subdoligranulum sp. TaxID=512298 RepID=UPI00260C0D82|nr:hypothetical protein [uncultured Subdoligranulum sp.]